jgi:large subunit ribosomal protein L46
MSACALCRRRGYATVTSAPLPELRTRIAAGALLSRAPLQLSPLSNFEKSYYAYSKRVRKALADDFEPEWYFRKGSQAERLFLDREDALDANQIEDGPDAANDKDGDLSSLNRRYDRTLYLLLRKKREQGAWQFRTSFARVCVGPTDARTAQGTVEESDASLKDAAMRELHEEVGPNLDLFAPGKVPASVYTYRLPESSPHSKQYDQTKVSTPLESTTTA